MAFKCLVRAYATVKRVTGCLSTCVADKCVVSAPITILCGSTVVAIVALIRHVLVGLFNFFTLPLTTLGLLPLTTLVLAPLVPIVYLGRSLTVVVVRVVDKYVA